MSDEVEVKPSDPESEVVVVEETKTAEVIETEEIDASPEKVMDELTSIEREIAIMHEAEVEETPLVESDALAIDECDSKALIELQSEVLENESNAADTGNRPERRNGVTTVVELNDAPDSTGSPAQTKTVDTQLEHEDLLAVLKGTDSKDEVVIETGVTIEGEGEFQIVDIIDNDDVAEVDPLAKDSPTKLPMTKEEEHKLALEQFQSLKNTKSRRRKQDIKSISQPADLVTSLVSDWSDGDEINAEDAKTAPVPKKKVLTPVVQVKPFSQAKVEQENSAAVAAKEKPATPQVQSVQKKVINASATTPAAASQPKKLINAVTASQEKKAPVLPPPSTFKRTRIIKRKIIWDPDAPETQFSYAKLVKPSTPTPAKKDTKKDRATPTPKKKEEPVTAAVTTATPASAGSKRQSSDTTTPVNGSKKKKFSEVDRLLGDEGAVNMLNSLEGDRTKRVSESDGSRTPATRKTTPSSTSPPERAQTPQKKDSAQPKRRTPKPKASSSWDYVYKQQTDDSMIIRRRSNSSYSSSASINRLSVDGPASTGKTPKSTPKASPKTPQASPLGSSPVSGGKTQDPEKQFEFAKPENKNKAKKMRSPIILVNSLSADMKKAANKRPAKSPVTTTEAAADREPSDVWVVKVGSVRQVTFTTHSAKLSNTFTAKLMNELSQTLEDLNEDPDCNAVVLLSEGTTFCQGIDFTDLALGTPEKRKNASIQMASAVKHFLTTLTRFKKPLIAGVGGANSGLGVTMLPLFDVVIGSDKGTYETPYAKIGQIPEGYYIFSETPKVRSTFRTKLLWLAEKLHSTESALSGLVNKLTSVSKLNEEALACAKRIASNSSVTYAVMKERSLEHTLPHIIAALDEEESILVQQWCSAPCVENFKHFIHKGQW